ADGEAALRLVRATHASSARVVRATVGQVEDAERTAPSSPAESDCADEVRPEAAAHQQSAKTALAEAVVPITVATVVATATRIVMESNRRAHRARKKRKTSVPAGVEAV